MERFHHTLVDGTARLSDIGLPDAGVVLSRAHNDIPAHHTHTYAAAPHAHANSTMLQDPFDTVPVYQPNPAGPRKGRTPARTTFVAQVAYKGAAYSGWAVQPEPVCTVQGMLQRALTERLQPPGRRGESIRVAVAGRTDSGVHACAQVTRLWWCLITITCLS